MCEKRDRRGGRQGPEIPKCGHQVEAKGSLEKEAMAGVDR